MKQQQQWTPLRRQQTPQLHQPQPQRQQRQLAAATLQAQPTSSLACRPACPPSCPGLSTKQRQPVTQEIPGDQNEFVWGEQMIG